MHALQIISRGTPYKVLYDEKFHHAIPAYSWFIHTRGYCAGISKARSADGKRKTVFMHRLFTKARPDVCVDHINGDKLDNRMANLRLTTFSENQLNQNNKKRRGTKHGLRGVTQHTPTLWKARIVIRGKTTLLGYFSSPEAASAAYQAAVAQLAPRQCETGPERVMR